MTITCATACDDAATLDEVASQQRRGPGRPRRRTPVPDSLTAKIVAAFDYAYRDCKRIEFGEIVRTTGAHWPHVRTALLRWRERRLKVMGRSRTPAGRWQSDPIGSRLYSAILQSRLHLEEIARRSGVRHSRLRQWIWRGFALTDAEVAALATLFKIDFAGETRERKKREAEYEAWSKERERRERSQCR